MVISVPSEGTGFYGIFTYTVYLSGKTKGGVPMKRILSMGYVLTVALAALAFSACAADKDGNTIVNNDNSTNIAVNSNVNTGINLGGGDNKNVIKGNGEIKTEARNLEKFSSMTLNGYFEVVLQKGDKAGIKVTTDSNILPHVTTKIANGELTVSTDAPISTKQAIKVEVSSPDEIGKVLQNGMCKFTFKDLSFSKFQLSINGSSSAEISGKADVLTVEIQGTCSLNAKDFKAREASVSVSGAGKADVAVSDKLTADIKGIGSINYYGDPKEIVKNIAGLGSLNKK